MAMWKRIIVKVLLSAYSNVRPFLIGVLFGMSLLFHSSKTSLRSLKEAQLVSASRVGELISHIKFIFLGAIINIISFVKQWISVEQKCTHMMPMLPIIQFCETAIAPTVVVSYVGSQSLLKQLREVISLRKLGEGDAILSSFSDPLMVNACTFVCSNGSNTESLLLTDRQFTALH